MFVKENKKKRKDIKKVLSHKRHQATHWSRALKGREFSHGWGWIDPWTAHASCNKLSIHLIWFAPRKHQSLIPASFSQWLSSEVVHVDGLQSSNKLLSKPTNWHQLKKMSHLPVISLFKVLSFHTPPRFTRYLEITLTWVIWNSCTLKDPGKSFMWKNCHYGFNANWHWKWGKLHQKSPKYREIMWNHGMLIPDTVFQI